MLEPRPWDYEKRLFLPEAMLPSQLSTQRPTSGPHTLMQSIVEEALSSVVGRGSAVAKNGKYAKYRIAMEAYEWFFAEEVSYIPVSFIFCCQHLNLDPVPFRTFAKASFEKIPLPPSHAAVPGVIRAIPAVKVDHVRRVTGLPHWRVRIHVRMSGKAGVFRTLKLDEYGRTKEEAEALTQTYIASEAWRGKIPQLNEVPSEQRPVLN